MLALDDVLFAVREEHIGVCLRCEGTKVLVGVLFWVLVLVLPVVLVRCDRLEVLPSEGLKMAHRMRD